MKFELVCLTYFVIFYRVRFFWFMDEESPNEVSHGKKVTRNTEEHDIYSRSADIDEEEEYSENIINLPLPEHASHLLSNDNEENLCHLKDLPRPSSYQKIFIPENTNSCDSINAPPEIIEIMQKHMEEYKQIDQSAKIFFLSKHSNDIAVLTNDEYRYYIRTRYTTLGRSYYDSLEADINLLVFSQSRLKKIKISRLQALLELDKINNFLITNIGDFEFKVDGSTLMPQHRCKLQQGSILDFDGIVVLFIYNQELIFKISKELRKKLEES